MSTLERVQRVISENLGLEEEQVTPDSLLKDDLGADSLDCVEILMTLEEEFDMEISDEEAEKLDNGTVQDIANWIEENQ